MDEAAIKNQESKATAKLPAAARVVVIGGGAVGASILYHLAEKGWNDAVLLEKNELTSGSTWHAAGNCPNFVGSWTMMKIQSYSTSLYRKLGDLVDYPMNYHVTGAIRLAHSRQRMEEFRHVERMGRQMGVEFTEMSPSEMQDIHPFLETHDLHGGQWDPFDGDIDPAQLTQALAKGARDMGAKIIRFCPVTGARRDHDEWLLSTPEGEIRCEYLVNAAGYRANEVGKMFGRDVPCVSLAHQYLVSEGISELAERTEKVPLLRDPDSSYYLRQEKDGLLLGPYEKNCRAHWTDANDPMPDDFSFQLYSDDLERLEWYIEDACARVPILGTAGITRVVNGPIPYTPDGLPLIGQMPGVPNAFEACVFTFGIVQAGGAGKLMAEIIVEGESETDSWAVDPRRFTDHVDPAYTKAKASETYSHEYATHFPGIQWPAGRRAKTSPLYDTLAEAGASFGSYGGWERADWFAGNAAAGDDRPVDSYDRQPWFDAVGAECRHVAEHVGVLELTGFSRFHLEGAGSADWLRGLITGGLPKIGRIGLIYFASEKGKILTEMTATRLGDDEFLLMSGAGAYWHDRDLLDFALPDDGSISITDVTREMATLLVTGPKSVALMADLTGGAVDHASFPWLTFRKMRIGGLDVTAIRVSFAGEAGWELHCPMADIKTLYDAVWTAGSAHQIGRFGMLALDSMRLEKGYRSWKSDLTSDYTMLESGLGRWVNLGKEAFVGKAALEREHQAGPSHSFVTLTLDDPLADGQSDNAPFGEAVYLSTVLIDDKDAGLVVSAGYGHRVGKSIAMAVIDSKALETIHSNGGAMSVDVLGRMRPAHLVAGGVLYDPENARMKV
ncbi:MAG: FAD-dependent oxidoreductase [Bacteroidetes bacterium]|nr:FAD-dependent oxidoreductase [Bacteroidota bacterium]